MVGGVRLFCGAGFEGEFGVPGWMKSPDIRDHERERRCSHVALLLFPKAQEDCQTVMNPNAGDNT